MTQYELTLELLHNSADILASLCRIQFVFGAAEADGDLSRTDFLYLMAAHHFLP